MKTKGTNHRTFTRTTHLILYLILVIVFGFISCRFAKASVAAYGNPGDSIIKKLSDANIELVNRLAYIEHSNTSNSFYFYSEETTKDSISHKDLHYYFKKAIEPILEQSLRIESWMLDTGDGKSDTRIIEPEIRLESWMLPAKIR